MLPAELSELESIGLRAELLLGNHGIPFPGTFVVDEKGRVVAKYFEQGHRQRTTADTVLVKVGGVGGGERTKTRTEHLALEVYATQDRVRPGSRIMLVLDIELPPKMHVYAPGEHSYRPVSFSLDPDPHLWAHETEYPEAEVLHLPAIQESVPVYHGRVRITRDVTVSPRLAEPSLKISGSFEYQACDDEICYRPQQVPLQVEVELEPLDRERAPEPLRRKGRPDSR